MRRFLVTSDKFGGTAELIYDTVSLAVIDLRGCQITAETISAFKRAVPVLVADLATAFTAGTTVVEADFEISLDDFKREYPYSRNYHLLDKRWSKLGKVDQVNAYYAAIEYRKYCQRNEWYKPKIADSWLANGEYKNDWKKM
jgi:hypothetical protein